MYKKKQQVFLALVLLALPLESGAANDLQKLSLGVGDKAMSPLNVDKVLPEYLGYYKAEGLTLDFVAAGSNAAVAGGLFSGRLQIGVALANFQLPLLSKGQTLPGIDFFENAYPFKSAMAVSPGSTIKTYADLKGKRIGVSNFGVSPKAVATTLLRLVGLDPDNDVEWLAVGEGASAGSALQRGSIDALMHYKTSLGDIEASGVALRLLPLPAGAPMIGGSFMSTPPALLKDHRAWLVGFGRAMAKGHVFIQANPIAAAYIYTQMYPEMLPPGLRPAEQLKAVLVGISKLAPLLTPYDAKDLIGYMKPSEWDAELRFNGVEPAQIKLDEVYTNDLIKDINDFDHEKIREQAKNFVVPEAYRN
jgi:NitT/TauT family transport system substrate-binding protein